MAAVTVAGTTAQLESVGRITSFAPHRCAANKAVTVRIPFMGKDGTLLPRLELTVQSFPPIRNWVLDIVGLYWHPPTTQSCCAWTKKSQIRALGRTAPMLSMRIGSPGQRTHDYARHGTSTLGYLAGRSPWGSRRPGHRHRQGHRAAQTATSPSGVPSLPQTPRPRLPGAGAASGDGQLRHPQEPKSGRGWPRILVSCAFRAHLGIMDEPGGGVVGMIERQAIHRGPAAPSRS